MKVYLSIGSENIMKSQAQNDTEQNKLQRRENAEDSRNKTFSVEKIKKFFKRRKGWSDPDPDEVSIDNAYKTRWIWYHTILALELLMVNILLVAILIVLALKL